MIQFFSSANHGTPTLGWGAASSVLTIMEHGQQVHVSSLDGRWPGIGNGADGALDRPSSIYQLGLYLEAVGSGDESDCLECPSGFYGTEEAKAFCLPCLPGTRQPGSGKVECLDCFSGRFSDRKKTAFPHLGA